MNGINGAVLSICVSAVITGLFRMLIPDSRYKGGISLIVVCIFTLNLIYAFNSIITTTSIELNFEKSDIVDFTDILTEKAKLSSEQAVSQKAAELLSNNNIKVKEIYVSSHINDSHCIFINEIELVFSDNTDAETIEKAVRIVEGEVGDEVRVKYSIKKYG